MSKSPLKVEIVKPQSWVDRLSRWSPILIALCALVLTVYQGYTTRKHNRLSVHPIVNGTRHITTSPPVVQYTLSSMGLGPAVVTSYRVFIDGIKFEYDTDSVLLCWSRIWNQLGIPQFDNHVWITPTHLAEGVSLSPGREITILEIVPDSVTTDRVHLFEEKVMERLSIVVCYESVYGDQAGSVTFGPAVPGVRRAS